MAPVGRVTFPEDSPGEALCEDAAQLQQRTQYFRDASTMGCLAKAAAAVQRSLPEPKRQAVCKAKGRAEAISSLEEFRRL